MAKRNVSAREEPFPEERLYVPDRLVQGLLNNDDTCRRAAKRLYLLLQSNSDRQFTCKLQLTHPTQHKTKLMPPRPATASRKI